MYVSLQEVRDPAQSMTATAQPPARDSLVEDLIDRASRMFDRECGVPDEYFEPSDNSTSARPFYGDGTHYLKLDPHVGSVNTTITMPSGYTVPDFVEKDGYLILTGADHVLPPRENIFPKQSWWWRRGVDGWPSGVPVTVTAEWGFSATPSDVKMAVIEWVINLWREMDPASLKLTNLEGVPLREDIPPRVKRIASKWTTKATAVFV